MRATGSLEAPRRGLRPRLSDRYGRRMKIFRELRVRGDDANLRALLAAIEARPNVAETGWLRRKDLEEDIRRRIAADLLCFSGPVLGVSGRALVWLRERAGCVEVVNVVPEVPGSLDEDEYNRTLKAFHDEVLVPAVKNTRLSVELGVESFEPADTLGKDVARLLHDFASAANPSTGASHPADNARWRAFVIGAHRARVSIEADLLARWLREEWDFPSEVSHELAARYENDRALLQQLAQTAA